MAASDTNTYLLETTGTGVAAFDYDDDGWMDVFLVNGTRARRISRGKGADESPVSQPRQRHVRGRHGARGRWRRAAGGRRACAGDYDNDGRDDLFVTYWGQNRLYRNKGDGTFEDVTGAPA